MPSSTKKRLELALLHGLITVLGGMIVTLTVTCFGGCASLNPAVEDPYCVSLDESHLAWTAVGSAAGGVAAATGASGTLTATLSELDAGAGIALAVVSAVAGVVAITGALLSREYADRFHDRCQLVPLGWDTVLPDEALLPPEPPPVTTVDPSEGSQP